MNFNKGFMYSSAETKKVGLVQFGVLGPDEIRRMSVVEIKVETAFEAGIPKVDGLMDQRLGAIGRDFPCETCACDESNCAGHFGHIEFTKPVFHPGFFGVTMRVLKSVCFYCSRLKGSKKDAKFERASRIQKRSSRLQAISKLCEGKSKCDPEEGCGAVQPKFSKEGALKIRAEFVDAPEDTADRKQIITAERVLSIFKQISDSDADVLGLDPRYTRPEYLVLSAFPVPPPPVRPSIMMDATMRGEDDLTHKLGDIVKNNNALRHLELNGAPLHRINEQIDLLQYHVATYMNNEMPGLPRAEQKGGRPIKSINQRLKGKEGRVRGNIMGKRVNFSARTVITADPNLMLDEVGVPKTIAMNLTYPEVVTRFNYEEMMRLVVNGPDEYPGAKYVVRDDGTQIDLAYYRNRSDFDLQYGMKVVRHIRDGDCVMFNRQPSLHKMSIMGHRVRVLPYSTFRLNLSVTSPYNADFDGDEMNMHVPQSTLTRAEILELMMVPRCIVSPQGNKPVMGIVQDSLLACMLFTQRDTFFERDFVFNLLLHVKGWDGVVPTSAILLPKPLWTGKQLFSLILPDVNLIRFSNTHPDDEDTPMSPGDTKVLISKGELISGIVDKRTVGAAPGSLIHVTWKELGPQVTCELISNIQVLVNHFILHRGFSIGIGDAVADDATMDRVIQTIESSKAEVDELIVKTTNGELETLPGKTMMETFEAEVNKVLNGARDKSGSYAQKSLLPSNNVKRMVTAGSKGSFINISQICACVGQQNVEGKRIAYGFTRRTLPHFHKDDLGPESRGFVENSYLRGLTPTEFFFHAMGGREGLIDTAVKTAETGYIQRRLIKAMEDLMVRYDGTVRNSVGDVIQFLYGEDGLDGSRVEGQTLSSLRLPDHAFEDRFRLSVSDPHFGSHHGRPYLPPNMIDELRDDPEVKAACEAEFKRLQLDRAILRKEISKSGEPKWPLAVNVDRVLWNAKRRFSIGQNAVSDLSPKEVIDSVTSLCEKCVIIEDLKKRRIVDEQTREDVEDPNWALEEDEEPGDVDAVTLTRRMKVFADMQVLAKEAQENATLLFRIHLRAMLCAKELIVKHRLSRVAFQWVLGEIQNRFTHARVHPGEMIGAVAAQSIGEPATQMTLNTFHFAGVSAKNVTLGVPRLKEIINIAKNPKTPSLTVFLKEHAARDTEKAKQVQAELQHTTLVHVVKCTEIFFDPDPRNTVIRADQEMVSMFYEFEDDEDASKLSPWVLRIEVSKVSLMDRKLSMRLLKNKIVDVFAGDLHVMSSEENAENLVLRIRLPKTSTLHKQENVDGVEEGEMGDGGEQAVVAPGDLDEADMDELFLRKVEAVLLGDFTLGGIPSIKKVFMREPNISVIDESTGAFCTGKEWVLDTDGVNLLTVMAHEDVDHTRTMSNDVVEMFEVLGVEAVRAALLNEVRNVISFDGAYVNYRHLGILCDVMTYRGHLMSITRHGINRADTGPIMRATFEETTEILLDAAMYAERDRLRGVSENILLGQLANLGTGSFGLFLQESDVVGIKGTEETQRIDRFGGFGAAGSSLSTGLGGFGVVGATGNGMMPMMPQTPGPDVMRTPSYQGIQTPGGYSGFGAGNAFSPYVDSAEDGFFSPDVRGGGQGYPSYPGYSSDMAGGLGAGMAAGMNYGSATSPAYGGGMSPAYGSGMSPTSPGYSPTSPAAFSPTSPAFGGPSSPQYSPSSPAAYSPASPAFGGNMSPSSPQYSPSSPNAYGGSPSSPQYSPSSPNAYGGSPSSPMYSPSSPNAYGGSPSSPMYSPSSPNAYSPASPAFGGNLSPSSPMYSPSSPNAYNQSPSSPMYSPSSPAAYSPASPAFGGSMSPSSPMYSPSSPQFSPSNRADEEAKTPQRGDRYSPQG
ncbi:DNA-directed RNA polymerase II subunit 1 [Porphyridium purpureum]|uniref:DNA-directed RNA polymerase subunit n=1 Tax=Porphyridium purpureum TaxID=35688 RepID=A0A5J4YJT1_PORPP|nr:DNA-directed RNA polymerase II subunit 1 [Porphyridium purpureum]|eukprot:POR0624..scf251_18